MSLKARLIAVTFATLVAIGAIIAPVDSQMRIDGMVGITPGAGGAPTATRYLGGNGTAAAPTYSYTADPDSGFYRAADGYTVYSTNGSPLVTMGPVLFRFGAGTPVSWNSTASSESSISDTGLSRVSAGVTGVGTGGAGSVAGTLSAAKYLAADGVVGTPSLAFASEPGLGFYRSSAGTIIATATVFAIKLNGYLGFGTGRGLISSPADGVFNVTNGADTIGSRVKADALPTIASGFGTSPSVTAGSTPFAGQVNVGTGGVASGGTITFGGTAFPAAPFCVLTNATASTVSMMTANATTTTLNINVNTAWPASSLVNWICVSPK